MRSNDDTIDRMLAEHERKHGDSLDRALQGRPRVHTIDELQMLADKYGVTVHQDGLLVAPSWESRDGKIRTQWPDHARHWTDQDRAERRALVHRLYKDEGLAIRAVADKMNLPASTIQHDVTALGIHRRSMGKGTVREQVFMERRQQVRQLYEVEGYEPVAISEMLGCARSTVTKIIADFGMVRGTPRLSDKKTITLVDRAVTEMARMAQLLLDNPEVAGLLVAGEQAKEWEKPLAQIVRSVSRVRKSMKGSTKGEP